MDELHKNIVNILKEEHQDWVKHIQEAEEKGTGIDINLGGNFAERISKVNQELIDFKNRIKKKKGLFGR